MWRRGPRPQWLLGVLAVVLLLGVVSLGILSERSRQTQPLVSPFDRPWTIQVTGNSDWLQGAVWVKPTFAARHVAFSPDGKIVATAMGFGLIGLLRVPEGDLAHVLVGHTSAVLALAFSPDGQSLASIDDDGTVRLWSVHDGQTLKTFTTIRWCSTLAFSPDGKLLAAGCAQDVKLWEVDSAQERVISRAHDESIDSIGFSRDGRILVSSGFDGKIKVWRVDDFQELFAIDHGDRVSPPEFSVSASLLAYMEKEGEIKLYRLSDGSLARVIPGHQGTDWRVVAFSPDGELLAASNGNVIRLWRVANGALLGALNWQEAHVLSLSFSGDGQLLAAGNWDRTIKIWQIADRSLKLHVGGSHDSGVRWIALSSDGTLLASSATKAETVKLWQMPEGRLVRVLNSGRTTAGAFSPDGQLLATGGQDAIKLWRISNGTLVRTVRAYRGWVWSLVFSPDGTLLGSVEEDGGAVRVVVRRVSDTKELFSTGRSLSLGGKVAFSPDGQLLAACLDEDVRLYRVSDGSEVRTLTMESPPGLRKDVAFSPDGQLIASHTGSQIYIWKVADGREVLTLTDESEIQAIAFAPNGEIVASAAGQTIKLWDLRRGVLLKTLRGHGSIFLAMEAQSLSFSPDGKFIVSGGSDGLALWQIRD